MVQPTSIKPCANCAEPFTVTAQDAEHYQKIDVPHPTWCPSCRHRARLALRNSKIFHQTACASCQSPIQATLDPSKYSQILCLDCYQKAAT